MLLLLYIGRADTKITVHRLLALPRFLWNKSPWSSKQPKFLSDVTSEWLTCVLQQNNLIKTSKVISFKRTNIGEAMGYSSATYRLFFEYDVHEEGAPKSVVVKQMKTSFKARCGCFLGNMCQEVYICSKWTNEIPFNIPKLLYGVTTFKTDYMMVMEDVDGICPDPTLWLHTDDVPLKKVEHALIQLAHLHAKFWESPLLCVKWLGSSDRIMDLSLSMFKKMYKPFVSKWSKSVSLEFTRMLPELGELLPLAIDHLNQPPVTFIHGDYRLTNMLWREWDDVENLDFVCIDWQIAGRMKSIVDVAWWFCLDIPVATRRKYENHWIKLYLRTLVSLGVPAESCSYEEQRRSYTIGFARMLLADVMATQFMDLDFNEKARYQMETWVRRCCTACEDNNLLEVLRTLKVNLQ